MLNKFHFRCHLLDWIHPKKTHNAVVQLNAALVVLHKLRKIRTRHDPM